MEEQFGVVLRQILDKMGVSQQQLAMASGLSNSAISHLITERYQSAMSLETQLSIIDALSQIKSLRPAYRQRLMRAYSSTERRIHGRGKKGVNAQASNRSAVFAKAFKEAMDNSQITKEFDNV